MTLHIGILGLFNQGWFGGVQYISNLVTALSHLPKAESPTITLFVPQANLHDSIYQHLDVFPNVTLTPLVVPPRWRRAAYRLLDNRFGWIVSQARRAEVEVLFPLTSSPSVQFPLAWMGWIPDLQHKHYPEYFSARELAQRDGAFAQLSRRVPRLILSSRTVQADMEYFYPSVKERINVIHFRSVPDAGMYTGDPAAVRTKYSLPSKFLLVSNQFWAHKNHQTLFEAIKRLRDRHCEVPLVCTGSTADYRNPSYFPNLEAWIRQHQLEGLIRIVGLIPADDRMQLMRAAAAIVQPSLFEGWSTILEEGRMLGKVAFVSDISTHREQDLPNASYFAPTDAEDLADQIAARWDSMTPGPDLVAEGNARDQQAALVLTYAREFVTTTRAVLEIV